MFRVSNLCEHQTKAVFDLKLMVRGGKHKVVLYESGFRAYCVGEDCALNFIRHFTRSHKLLNGIKDGTDFYFVHSYHFRAADAGHKVTTTPYCGGFTSITSAGNVMGAQFHPEKSSRPGFQIIRNFLARERC